MFIGFFCFDYGRCSCPCASCIPIKIQNLLTKLNILLQFINLYSKNLDFSQKLKQKTQGFDKLRNAVWPKHVEFLILA